MQTFTFIKLENNCVWNKYFKYKKAKSSWQTVLSHGNFILFFFSHHIPRIVCKPLLFYKVFCPAPSLKKTREDASLPANQGFIKRWHHHVGRAFVGHRLQHGGAQALSITEQAAVCCKGELHVWRFCGKQARHVNNGLGVVSLHVVLLLLRQRLLFPSPSAANKHPESWTQPSKSS